MHIFIKPALLFIKDDRLSYDGDTLMMTLYSDRYMIFSKGGRGDKYWYIPK